MSLVNCCCQVAKAYVCGQSIGQSTKPLWNFISQRNKLRRISLVTAGAAVTQRKTWFALLPCRSKNSHQRFSSRITGGLWRKWMNKVFSLHLCSVVRTDMPSKRFKGPRRHRLKLVKQWTIPVEYISKSIN